jgi:tRNA (cytidine/uridine-2'-O-)-methyltransferase
LTKKGGVGRAAATRVPGRPPVPGRKGETMLHVALWEPEIPPNTGNVARLCAATGAALHLIGRLGFRLDDRSLRRAGLDYWDAVLSRRHAGLEDFEAALGRGEPLPSSGRILCFSAHARTPYTRPEYQPGDCLLFGSESRGLPESWLRREGQTFCVPMPAGQVRSLNLATVVGIVLYEALRQLHRW